MLRLSESRTHILSDITSICGELLKRKTGVMSALKRWSMRHFSYYWLILIILDSTLLHLAIVAKPTRRRKSQSTTKLYPDILKRCLYTYSCRGLVPGPWTPRSLISLTSLTRDLLYITVQAWNAWIWIKLSKHKILSTPKLHPKIFHLITKL